MTMKAMGKRIVRQVGRTGAYKERERGSWRPFIPITGVQPSEGCEHTRKSIAPPKVNCSYFASKSKLPEKSTCNLAVGPVTVP